MNRMLGFLFFMLFLAGMAFLMLKDMRSIGDEDAPDTPVQQALSLISRNWQLPTEADDTLPPVFVRFELDGKISGFGGCNSFFGSYIATDKTIDVHEIGSTRKLCPEPVMHTENTFLGALQSATEYRIEGTALVLTLAAGNLLELSSQQDSPPP